MKSLIDKNYGRTRVNTFCDAKKNSKRYVNKNVNMTNMDKLYQLQNVFFKDGMKIEEYENYIQEKINNDKYYYKNLNNDNIESLKDRFRKLHQRKKNKLNLVLSERNRKNRQKKLFKEKKSNMINIQKMAMIDSLFKEFNKSRAIGLTMSTDKLSNNPENWKKTKFYLFTGGRYLESSDKNWVDIYRKLESNTSAHLFDLHSSTSLNDRINGF
jgi:hypothetical protein